MLEFNSVDFSYNAKQILFNDLSCCIKEKTFTCLFGMNGIGKSTFAKLSVGLLKPQKGRISYNSKPIDNIELSYLQQKKHFGEDLMLNVFEFVLMGTLKANKLFFNNEDNTKVLNTLQNYGLSEFKYLPLKLLSGGQIQRALIARMLVTNPELIVLDEPFDSLDIEAREIFMNELLKLKNSRTIIMVCHDIDIISRLADEIICISNTSSNHYFIDYFQKIKLPVVHLCRNVRCSSHE